MVHGGEETAKVNNPKCFKAGTRPLITSASCCGIDCCFVLASKCLFVSRPATALEPTYSHLRRALSAPLPAQEATEIRARTRETRGKTGGVADDDEEATDEGERGAPLATAPFFI